MSRNLTILVLHFTAALVFSLALTPVARFVGTKLGAVDQPNERKMHSLPIPRIGGLSICLSFLASLFFIPTFFGSPAASALDREMVFFLSAGVVVFCVGLLDDFFRIGYRAKFAFQVLAATLAFAGGIRITNVLGLDLGMAYGIVSYAVTVFWFLLFINALNLIDGLDGLAAGIAFFTSVVLATTAMWRGSYSDAFLLGSLAGAGLGFLRYNFNPASIFMGDGGSYFLGYTIAGMAILGSTKSEAGATILIPLVALGVPIFDTLIAPLRRFVLGKRMFRPDTGHIHHRLVAMGFSTRRAVLIMYAASVVLCLASLILVNLQNIGVGIFLAALALVAFLFVSRLGYLQHMGPERIYGWIKDVSDEAGLSRDRRSFLNLQLEICGSKSVDELWKNTCRALSMLDFDMSKMQIDSGNHAGGASSDRPTGTCTHLDSDQGPPEASTLRQESSSSSCIQAPLPWWEGQGEGVDQSSFSPPPSLPHRGGGTECGLSHSCTSVHTSAKEKAPLELTWTQNGFTSQDYACRQCLFKVELPLLSGDEHSVGSLLLVKDLKRSSLGHYTLRRVEHLRRSIMRGLEKLSRE